MKLLKQIFSITNEDLYKVFTIFGIKIRTFNTKKAIKQLYSMSHQNEIIDLLDIFCDPKLAPKATGILRTMQLGIVEILKEVDYVCKQNNIEYWLDFGTLLGAVRHSGFIPWDDDLDIGMTRENREKFIEVFDKQTRNKNMHVDMTYYNDDSHYHRLLKVRVKNIPTMRMDIFAYDFINNQFDTETQKKMSKDIHQKLKQNYINNKEFGTDKFFNENLDNYRKDLLQSLDNGIKEKPDIMFNIDFLHDKKTIFSYDDIFPLKEIEFEGHVFPIPNKTHKYLSELFGEYLRFPRFQINTHFILENIPPQEEDMINDFIEENSKISV